MHGGAQRYQDQRIPVVGNLPLRLEGAVAETGAGEDETVVEGLALDLDLPRQEDDIRLLGLREETAHVHLGHSVPCEQPHQGREELGQSGMAGVDRDQFLGHHPVQREMLVGGECREGPHGGQSPFTGQHAAGREHRRVVDDQVGPVGGERPLPALQGEHPLTQVLQRDPGEHLAVDHRRGRLVGQRRGVRQRARPGPGDQAGVLPGHRIAHPVAAPDQFLHHREGGGEVSEPGHVEESDMSFHATALGNGNGNGQARAGKRGKTRGTAGTVTAKRRPVNAALRARWLSGGRCLSSPAVFQRFSFPPLPLFPAFRPGLSGPAGADEGPAGDDPDFQGPVGVGGQVA